MIQDDMFKGVDPSADCSREAREKVDVKRLRQLCLEEYERKPIGATSNEICMSVANRLNNMNPRFILSIRPRVTELKKEGIIITTGQRRGGCAVLIMPKFWRKP